MSFHWGNAWGFPSANTLKSSFLKRGITSENEARWKSFTPVSHALEEGSFELLIKIYRKTETFPGGRITPYFESLNENDEFEIIGPKGQYEYLKNAEFFWRKESRI